MSKVAIVTCVCAAGLWLLATQTTRSAASDGRAAYLKVGRGQELPSPAGATGRLQRLSSADFDEDGVADLVVGMDAGGGTGMIAIYRGNLDSLFPNSPEAQQHKAAGAFVDSPFLEPSTMNLDVVPEFLAAADFDGDGHQDVIAAARMPGRIAWLRGTGDGGFLAPLALDIDGVITAMLGVDSSDGDVARLVIGVTANAGAQALLFDALQAGEPEGAILAEPRSVALSAPADALAAGQLDDDAVTDVAVAAGREVVVIHGQHTRDAGDDSTIGEVISRTSLTFTPRSMGIGRFGSESVSPELAVLAPDGTVYTLGESAAATTSSGAAPSRALQIQYSAATGAVLDADKPAPGGDLLVVSNTSTLPGDDVLVLDRASRRIHLVPPRSKTSLRDQAVALDMKDGPVAVLPMRLNADATQDLVVIEDGHTAPTVFLTASARTFIVDSLADEPDCSGTDGVCRIGPVDAEGHCMGGCTFRAALQEANLTSDLDTIQFSLGTGTPTIVRQPGADWTAIYPVNIDGNTGGATRVGLDGGNVATNTLIIRGGSSTVRNLVINRGAIGLYVAIAGGNVFEGNLIGLDPTGTVATGNSQNGISIVTASNTVGGVSAAARNVISGNGQNGIGISSVSGNTVLGNYIGTDVTGSLDLGNGLSGIRVETAPATVIGGTVAGSRNVISGNHGTGTLDAGVVFLSSPNSRVQGNFIGVTAAGDTALGNAGPGLRLLSGSGETIGGTTTAARNVIAGNAGDGVIIRSPNVATNTVVQGNYIGTTATGAAALGNGGNGVLVTGSHNNTVGGTVTGSRNVISGNGGAGVRLEFAGAKPSGNVVRGNYIGTNAAGSGALPNSGRGIVFADATGNTIGGTTATARNVISGNIGVGLHIDGSNNVVQGNYIGTSATGAAMGNSAGGVYIENFETGNVIGGDAKGVGSNTIAFNNGPGIVVAPSATGHAIRSNSLFSNTSLGIDLGADGVTANDSCDADAGANNRQNFPVLTHVTGLAIDGTLNSKPGESFTVYFYSSPTADPSGYGEGKVLLGSKAVTTNASCTANFTMALTKPIPLGDAVTATATDAAGNTSEFSAAVPATGAIAVTVPNTAVKWAIGTTQAIKWSHNLGASSFVKIEVSRDGGATYTEVAASVKNAATTGTYNWLVTGPTTAAARIRVTALSDPTITDASNVNFTIANPLITVTRPDLATHIWTVGTTQSITWTSNLGATENVKVELSTDGGSTFPIVLLASTPSDGKQTVVVQPAWVSETARVRITWVKDATVFDVSNQDFPIR